MAKIKDRNDYSEEYVKKHRSFPFAYTVLLVILVLIQIGTLLFAIFYEPTPQDIIESYCVTVTPKADGTLDITYDILWCALDESEPLTFVTLGMANANFFVYESSLSDTIESYCLDVDGDYVGLRLDLKKSYLGGEKVHLTIKVNQSDVLCKTHDGYFYEFVPGWFNSIPVEHYEFKWKHSNMVTNSNGTREGAYYVWSGQLACGGYDKMQISYANAAFEGCHTVSYKPFDDDGAYNALQEGEVAVWIIILIVWTLILIGEVYIIDSYVSYRRGRGFLTSYGHRVHIYGRVNPRYRGARSQHVSRGGGGGGRGCACACACACAGGGRAGCSQKDTYGGFRQKEKVK